MPRWIERLTDASFRVRGWFYAALFLGFGILFLYGSGRGLLGYAAGVRAAWSDPIACVAGVVAGGLSLWASLRLWRWGVPPMRVPWLRGTSAALDATLEEAARLEKTDPAASQHLLDSYFMREAAETETRRAELRQRASSDLNAALELQRELQHDMATNAAARKDVLKEMPESDRASILAQIDTDGQKMQSEILELAGTIERLRLR